MAVTANGTHLIFNNNSTQNTAFLGSIAAANITGQITAPQIAPGVIPAGGATGTASVFTSPGPFNIPPTTTRIKVTVVGGGGNGGTAAVSGCCGGAYSSGGGGGGVAVRWIGSPFPVTCVPVTVGGASGTSSFGSYVSATGGTAGNPASGSTIAALVPGGAGSTPVPATGYNIPGSPSLPSTQEGGFAAGFSTINSVRPGAGPPARTIGAPGIGYGGGGGGGYAGCPAWPSGSAPATPGIVIIEY